MAERELIPNLPPDSVFVVDNAACNLHLNLLQLHLERANTYWIWGHDLPPPSLTGCASPNCIVS